MPTGFNAAYILSLGLAILIFGTAWRLLTLHAVASSNPTVKQLGQAMAFQY